MWFAVSFREKELGTVYFVMLKQRVWEMLQPRRDLAVSADPSKCQGFICNWPDPADRGVPSGGSAIL